MGGGECPHFPQHWRIHRGLGVEIEKVTGLGGGLTEFLKIYKDSVIIAVTQAPVSFFTASLELTNAINEYANGWK